MRSLGFEVNVEGKVGPTRETVFYYETYPGCPKATLSPKEHQDFQWVTFNEAIALIHYESNREAFTLLMRKLEIQNLRRPERRK